MPDECPYDRRQIEGLITGYWTDQAVTRVHFRADSWAQLRSRAETFGQVDEDGWVEVLDLERALGLLAAPLMQRRRGHEIERQARVAAALIATRLLLGWGEGEMRPLVRPGDDPERLIRKGAAWIAAYLSGQSIEGAEAAFRRAR